MQRCRGEPLAMGINTSFISFLSPLSPSHILPAPTTSLSPFPLPPLSCSPFPHSSLPYHTLSPSLLLPLSPFPISFSSLDAFVFPYCSKVQVVALQNLVKIMSLYYQYMEAYMGPALFAVSRVGEIGEWRDWGVSGEIRRVSGEIGE